MTHPGPWSLSSEAIITLLPGMLIIVTHHPNAYMHPFDVPSLWTYQGMIGILTVGRIFNVKDFAEAQLEDCCG